MRLSEAGKLLLSRVRTLLEIESAACQELRALEIRGDVRLGMPEDFASSRLANTLTRFRRAHPGVRVEGVIERNSTIAAMARRGELDLAMVISRRRPASSLGASRRRSYWYASQEFVWDRASPLPLVLLDAPCIYRDDALSALKRAGIQWEITFRTESVTAMWAAVASGIGVSARMDLGAPRSVACVDDLLGLPELPSTSVSLVQVARSGNEAIGALASLVEEALMSLSNP